MSILRKDFASRGEMASYLSAAFPHAQGTLSETRGGRQAAEAALARIEPERYAGSRNFLDGAVSRLSMYIRHGILSLAEVRRAALARTRYPDRIRKFIQELAWRHYWQRVWAEIGDGIWIDREEYKTGLRAEDYADELPPDIERGETGLACIDSFSRELRETGYLHNHARMWVAAYVVHWRRVRWQAGARWFLRHLLDGDPASNNLSWQWVASTFSHKPYQFTQGNLDHYSGGRYCPSCPLRRNCPFEAWPQ
jgi:deoxyribodipyrimidine photo-lyase